MASAPPGAAPIMWGTFASSHAYITPGSRKRSRTGRSREATKCSPIPSASSSSSPSSRRSWEDTHTSVQSGAHSSAAQPVCSRCSAIAASRGWSTRVPSAAGLAELDEDQRVDREDERGPDRPPVQVALDRRAGRAALADAEGAGEPRVLPRVHEHEEDEEDRDEDLEDGEDDLHGVRS